MLEANDFKNMHFFITALYKTLTLH